MRKIPVDWGTVVTGWEPPLPPPAQMTPFQLQVLADFKDLIALLGSSQQSLLHHDLQEIITLLKASSRVPSAPTRLALALPISRKKDGTIMAYQLKNDVVDDILIVTTNDQGTIVPAPAGDVDSVVSSDPTKLNAVIGTMPAPSPFAGSPSLRINALMKGPFIGTLTATISDSAGLRVDMKAIDIVEDLAPTTISTDDTNVVHTPQPVPLT